MAMKEASEKQLGFVKAIEDTIGEYMPKEFEKSSYKVSQWIGTYIERVPKDSNGNPIFKRLPSEKQVGFARMIERTLGVEIPAQYFEDVKNLSGWIDEHLEQVPVDNAGNKLFAPSEKQANYLKLLAKRKSITPPDECFRDAKKCSAWIDEHK